MKWKKDIRIVNDNGYEVVSESSQLKISHADEYIVMAMERGIQDDNELIRLIMKEEHTDDIEAGLRLAKFLLEYGEYIEELSGHQVIEG